MAQTHLYPLMKSNHCLVEVFTGAFVRNHECANRLGLGFSVPLFSWTIVPPELRNTMMLSGSATRTSDLVDFCSHVVVRATGDSSDTLMSSRVRMMICVLPDVVKRCPVADLSSAPDPLGLRPKQSDRLCFHTDVASPESVKNSFSPASRSTTITPV